MRHASAGSIELEQDTEQSHAVLEQCKDDRGADQDSAVFPESSTSGFVCFYGNKSVVSTDCRSSGANKPHGLCWSLSQAPPGAANARKVEECEQGRGEDPTCGYGSVVC